MKLILSMLLFASSMIFAQTKEEIINDFLNFVDSKKIIQYSIIHIMDDEAEGISKRSANCTFFKAPEDTVTGFYYHIKTESTTSIYNSTEYLQYYPELYGNKTVKVVSTKKNPGEFKGTEIVMNGQTYFADPLPKSPIFFGSSIIQHYNDLKEDKYKRNWIVLPDTIIDCFQCKRIMFETPFIYDGDTSTASAIYSFDKTTGILVHYKVFVPSQNREELYFNFVYDNLVSQELITRKSFPKGTKFSEHPKEITKNKKMLKAGQIAPGWELMNLEDKKISLEELKGSPVFLIFSKIGCAPCVSAIPIFNELVNEYPSLKIVSIYSIDKKEALVKLAKKKKMNYDILYNSIEDDAKNTCEKYHINGYPSYYVIDRNGIISYSDSGYGDGLKKVWAKEIEKVLK